MKLFVVTVDGTESLELELVDEEDDPEKCDEGDWCSCLWYLCLDLEEDLAHAVAAVSVGPYWGE